MREAGQEPGKKDKNNWQLEGKNVADSWTASSTHLIDAILLSRFPLLWDSEVVLTNTYKQLKYI